MNLRSFVPAILAVLGLSSFHEEQGRQMLKASEKEKLKSLGFKDDFLTAFETAINNKGEDPETGDDSRVAVLSAALAQTSAQLLEANASLDELRASASTNAEALAANKTTIAELRARVATLAEMSEPDDSAQASPASVAKVNLADEKQLCGFPGVMFALDRPYNRRALAALYAREGKVLAVDEVSSIDYSTLNEDLGAFYRIPWRERIESTLRLLPTIEKIFPTEYGYQDLATLVNVFLGEFSQADNTIGSSFDRVAKGSYDFGQETLRMFSVMFVHRFQNLAEVERTWIGYLNREGSDPVKMSLVEFLLAETAKVLHNERELRRVNGVRKDPNPNKPGRAMDAADGLYEFIRKKVDGFIDYTVDAPTVGKKVYQIKPFPLPHITEGNIGEVIYLGTSMIPAHLRDSGNIACYIPSSLVHLYHRYNEAKYGTNQDYKANIMYVKEFPSVELIPVPNADNHQRLIWTTKDNIKTFGLKRGEMLNFKIEQQDWNLKVWSNWKESIWARTVGFKYTDRNKMDGTRQFIWCNDYDFADSYFLQADPGKNPSALRHSSLEVSGDGNTLTITDVSDLLPGVAVSLKAGSEGAEAVNIEKKGAFELISTDWNPAKGDVIRLMKREDGKFIELGRETSTSTALMFNANETAPSVAFATAFVVGENTEATAITDLQNAIPGILYTIHGNGTENASTIANGDKFALLSDMTLSAGSLLKLVKTENGKFYEVARVEAVKA